MGGPVGKLRPRLRGSPFWGVSKAPQPTLCPCGPSSVRAWAPSERAEVLS